MYVLYVCLSLSLSVCLSLCVCYLSLSLYPIHTYIHHYINTSPCSPKLYLMNLYKSRFSLALRGDHPVTRHLYDAIRAGTLSVLVDDYATSGSLYYLYMYYFCQVVLFISYMYQVFLFITYMYQVVYITAMYQVVLFTTYIYILYIYQVVLFITVLIYVLDIYEVVLFINYICSPQLCLC